MAKQGFHAHRITRLLQKDAAANQMGLRATLLVVFVAHTEDAARYKGPVTFWNSQLMETLGCTSPKQLNEARKAAVEAGWLIYRRDGTRSVGLYETQIPEHALHFNDQPIEEPLIHSPGGKNEGPIHSPGGKNEGPIHSPGGKNSGMNSGTNSGMNSGTNSGKPSSLTLYPEPSPEKGAGASVSKRGGVQITDLQFSEEMDSESVRQAMAEWLDHHRSIGKPYRSLGAVQRLLKRFADRPDAFVDAVDHSISSNYQGLFERNQNGKQGSTKPAPKPGSRGQW